MKIVFLETATLGEDITLDHFNQLGEVTKYSYSSPEENASRLADADILVVNKILINEELLKDAKNLKFIAASATGTNNIDFNYVNSRGIVVSNARGYSTDSVVQHTFAMLFYLYEKLRIYDDFVKDGSYAKHPLFSCFTPYFNEISGKTWGIIGLGAIGRGVAKIAEAFGCKIIYYSTSGRNTNAEYTCVSYEELLAQSDIVSIHCPLTPSTEKLVDYDAISRMKKDAYLLNLGRGPIIDEEGLARALNENLIAGAALDVLCTEPLPLDNPLMKVTDKNKLLITPHMAWGTREARVRCIDEVYKNVEAFIQGKPRNVCN